MNATLHNQTVVIAGGGSGMGLALAQRAVAAGATVHLLGRTLGKLIKAHESLVGQGDGAVEIHVIDISQDDEVAAFAATLDRVDHLVTTAADLVFKPLLDMQREDVERIMSSKFLGAVHLVRHLAPKMSHEGSITFFSGSAAYKAAHGASIVAAMNAALDGLARTLALELAPIRVNVVSPGIVDSSTWDFLPDHIRVDTLKSIGSGLPTGRVGTSAELADAAMFVIGNGFTTGSVLQIDGGANA